MVIDIANEYGFLVYLVIFGLTFFEGETIVLICGALISNGDINLSVTTLAFFAMAGSFCGDQTWFYIGRRYGSPLLARWPTMADKVQWAFDFLRRNETLFILSFRFIYGVRNISPFVIGMAGVSRLKFFILNLIAAAIWANIFAWGGFFIGRALEHYVGESKFYVLGGLLGAIVLFSVYKWLSQRQKIKALKKVEASQPPAHTSSIEEE